MNCHLLVPNLFWPATAGVDPYRALAAPALETLLARGRCGKSAGGSLERWLATAFRLDPAHDAPLAPFALLGEGLAPGAHGWVVADPVHLKVHGGQLILAESSRFAITRPEAGELVSALNAHFASREIALVAPRPQRWFARTSVAPRIRTTPTAEVAGGPIERFLPAGEDGAQWRAIINEAQMVLHPLPCNQRRETRGELPVNSVWFWGAGQAPQPMGDAPYSAVWTNQPLAAGLAAASGIEAQPLPDSGETLLRLMRKAPQERAQLAVLELPPAAAYDDAALWREAVLAIERGWLAPVLSAWRSGELTAVTLDLLGPDFSYRTHSTRRDRYRFWRSRRPLRAYIA